MEEEGWQIDDTLGHQYPKPVYMDVNTAPDQHENLLRDGQMLTSRRQSHMIITVDINMQWRNSVVVEGLAAKKKAISQFATGLEKIFSERNFYRGAKFEFSGRLRFLDLREPSWESIMLDGGTKREIKANSIGFLSKREMWERYGIPLKRGVLLAGEPGTGKTIICKALMAEAKNTTCVTSNAYDMDAREYFTELYEAAPDLSPSIVFIEDIDLIGQNRDEFGYSRGNALLSLLAVLDVIEEKKEIVTVATTNCLETLYKALSQRPSRLDRVIILTRPELKERRELVSLLCRRIPLPDSLQDYIAARTEGCSPAQVQAVVHSLVIEHVEYETIFS
ncbi:AAA family ATPase [Chloroflexota bacterium]